MKAIDVTDSKPLPLREPSGCLRGDASLGDPGIIARPSDFYGAVREKEGLHFDPKINMYLVSRYEDILAVVKDPLLFSVKRGYEELYAKGFLDEFKEILIRDGGGFFPDHIMTDPPEHTPIRKLLEGAFTAHRVRMIEPAIREVAADMVEAILARGEIDGVSDFAVPLTVRTVCRKLGIDEMDATRIHDWAIAMTAQVGSMQSHEDMLSNAAKMAELQHYIIALIEDRKVNRSEDMISDLVHGHTDDPKHPVLKFEELVSLSRLLMLGGIDNTASGVSSLLLLLATQPDVMDRLQEALEDDRLMNSFVEEFFRLEAPARGTARMTTREVELGGTVLPEGAHLLMLWGSASRDEAQFAEADKFKVNRPNLRRHVAFGGGIHFCVGVALAKLELKIAAQEIGKRVKAIELTIPAEDVPYLPTVATHIIKSLPIRMIAKD